jgi:thiol-disulfide isomerase/thioredoxin
MVVQYPRVKRMNRITVLSPAQWIQRFEGFPRVGQEVSLLPYFDSRVTAVEEQAVTLEALVSGETQADSPLGTVAIQLVGEEIIMTLDPEMQAQYLEEERTGRIVSLQDDTFTVDFNPPLSGKPLVLDLEVIELVKAAEFEGEIAWVEDHDAGLAQAEQTDKPAVVVLYAGWCGWSKKLLNDSLTDPRVKRYKDRFVWIKVDSDQNQAIKARYDQQGYPLVLILNGDQAVEQRIDGFRDAGALASILREVT